MLLQKMNNYFLFKYFKSLMLLIAAVLMLSSCSGGDALTQESIDGDTTYGGFAGLNTVETLTGTILKLTWTRTSDPRVEGYVIYDVTAPTPVAVKEVGPNISETTITGLSEGFLRKYRVRIKDRKNKEDTNTNDLFGIPYGGVQSYTVISSTSARLNYRNPSGMGALEANAYCRTSPTGEWQHMAHITDMEATSVVISGLQVNTTYTCKVSLKIDGFEDNNIQTVSFTALGEATRLVFATQPGNAQSGQPLSVQPVIHVLDENDNIVSGGPDATALVTLSIAATSPTGGAINGIYSVNAVGGVATFSDLSFLESGSKILTATKEDTSSLEFGTGVMTVDSEPFNIAPGNVSPTLSTIEIDPPINPPFDALVANGTDSYTVIITLRDVNGNPVAGTRPEFSSNIPGDFITQPLSPTNASGVSTGSIATTIADTSPARRLSVSVPAGLNSVQVLAPFKPGPANKLAFFVQPSNSPAGANGMNEVKVAVQDAQSNVIVSGSGSDSSISLSISNNVDGAVLSGTNPVTAVNGIATFGNLGIDKTKNGYRLVANSGSLTPATSNTFNITAGIPRVISMTGPEAVLSGACSAAITLQLQDFGGNPSKAIQSTTVQISGLGSATLYTSGSCGGSPVSPNVTFTPGTDTRTFYLKDVKSESLDIVGTDASSVLVSSNYNIKVTPSKMQLIAEAAPPAAPGTLLTVTAGACSTPIIVKPLADDNSDGQVFGLTNVSLTGIAGSQAKIYSDASCTTEINPSSFALKVGATPDKLTRIYLQDPKGENLSVNVSDPAGHITTVSLPQDIKVLASKINFTGPSTVVSGMCSAVFTITLRDTLNNAVPAHANTSLNIIGVNGVSTTGFFYTSPSCGGTGFKSSVTVPANSATTTIYFKGLASEVLNILIRDPQGKMTDSQTRQLTVTPSALKIAAPTPAESLVSECKGPFKLQTLDGQGNVSPVVNSVTANMSGAGDAAKYYLDNECETSTTTVTVAAGTSEKNFYFKAQYPGALTLAADDADAILSGTTQNWTVKADWGWIGTASKQYDENGDLLPFRTGVKPVSARYDGLQGPRQLAFDPTHRYLFVADYEGHKILKYDYLNTTYVGWIGRLRLENNIGSTGSTVANPSPALCISTTNNQPLPGWCLGGRSIAGETTTGGVHHPIGITVDSTYVYVSNYHGHTISRHRADTGAFDGWVGAVNTVAPTGPATNGPAGCASTQPNTPVPGWCKDGNSRAGAQEGDGRLRYPRGITTDSVYLYVGVEGAVQRYDKTTGAFQGWIGMVNSTPDGGAVGCNITNTDQLTPGWCIGGTYKAVNPRNHGGTAGGMYHSADIHIIGNDMYVLSSGYSGVINRYDKTTGAFIETLPNLNFTWVQSGQMAFNGTNFFVADDERILKVSQTGLIESWMGKVANNSGMIGNPGCNSLQPNQNTPGWCLGGTHKPGLDETSFIDALAIAYDGDNSIVVSSQRVPALKKFNATTGAYIGSLALESDSPKNWTSDRNIAAEYHGFDDHSSYTPMGTLISGDHLFVAERESSRIKKLNKKTGELLGWIGGITSKPTGGVLPGCLSANAMGPSPSWCLGSSYYPTWTWNDPQMIGRLTDGVMYQPTGLATDGTWLYVTDYGLHRIQRFNASTGAYGGWIGRIDVSPTGGDPGCNGAAVNSFTPGWCLGGISKNGNSDGHLYGPTGIIYQAGNLYVIDTRNDRVVSYQAVTGGFNGWIGRIGSNPSSGCTVASNGSYNVSTSGWCIGGTSSRANYNNDRGGGFNFDYGYDRQSLYSDGLHLYITNTRNNRIDKYTLNGQFVGAVRTREDQYINGWVSSQLDVANVGNGFGCSYPIGIWGDANYLYGVNAAPCSRDTDQTMSVWKMDKATGNMIGWQGAVSANSAPTGGDPGCAGATTSTPGWCQGGRVAQSVTLGGFSAGRGMIFGDDHFLYVSDSEANRVMRIPK